MSIAQCKAARRRYKNASHYRRMRLKAEARRVHHGKNAKPVKR